MPAASGSQAPNAELAVSALGLRKRFGDVVACDGVDLSVGKGEILGLVGPDGAGKTTTMRMLCGVLDIDAGDARVDGYDVRTQPESVKRHIGYLPQRFALHRDLTIDENIRYFADLYEIPAGTWEQRRDELLEITYLTPFRRRLTGRLSGGMRQKVSLVCTLIHRPHIVFLDEPTTGVDPVSRRDFWKILYDLPRQGVTMLISTPYMDEASRCTHVAFMDRGRVLAADTPAALRTAYSGVVVHVRCEAQRQTRELLKTLDSVTSVEVFGDRLHVVFRPGADILAARRALNEAGVDCRQFEETQASLEDVFVSMATVPSGTPSDAPAGDA